MSSFFFQKLYTSIRSEPFKIPEDDGNDLTLTFFNPDREGWLLKMGETVMVIIIMSLLLHCTVVFRLQAFRWDYNICVNLTFLSLWKVVVSKPGRGDGLFWQTVACTTLNTPQWVSVSPLLRKPLWKQSMQMSTSVLWLKGGVGLTVYVCLLFLQDKDPIGIIPLENLCVKELQDTGKKVQYLLLFAVCE